MLKCKNLCLFIFRKFNPFGATTNVPFTRTQFQPFDLYTSFDDYARGLANQECQRLDHFASEAVCRFMKPRYK